MQQTWKNTIAMKISHKLVGSFIGISLLTGAIGAVAIVQSVKIAETLAISGAKNAAQVFAVDIASDAHKRRELLVKYSHSAALQRYVMQLHNLQKQDVEVVNRQRRIVAGAMPEEVGQVLKPEHSREVEQTLQDGISRTFVEKSAAYPQGIKLVVVPLQNDQHGIDGVVLLEWSTLYEDAIAQARPTLIAITTTSLGGVILAMLVGLQISSSIAKSLESVTAVAQRITQESNFDLQAPVTTQDETATVAVALNHLIQRVKTLLTEKEQRSEALQQTLTQLHTAQLQLVQTEKMSSLGQLVAGVAHEINNPINFIHGNLTYIASYTQDLLKVVQVYQTHYPQPPETLQATLKEVEIDFLNEDLIKLLQSMRFGTDRIREIVLSLRNFARLDEAEYKAVNIHEGIDSTLVILHQRLKAKTERPEIQIIQEYGQLPLVECYAGQINQVFMNILSNAVDAFEESNQGKSFEEINNHPNIIHISTAISDGQQVTIAISDNGAGISENVRSRLFDPFFTTKAVGKGTGLGLSISYQIVVEKHNGSLWCESTANQGTKFVIEIPIQQKNVGVAQQRDHFPISPILHSQEKDVKMLVPSPVGNGLEVRADWAKNCEPH